jgi:hypothetical protein
VTDMVEGRVAGGLAARLAEVLEPGELAELAELIGPGGHDVCAEVTRGLVAAALERGRAEGWLRCMGEHKAVQQGVYRDLKLERVRWARLCPACAAEGRRRPRCQDCLDGTRSTFGRPVPGDYQGGPVTAWLVVRVVPGGRSRTVSGQFSGQSWAVRE